MELEPTDLIYNPGLPVCTQCQKVWTYCGIIIVRDESMFMDFVGYSYLRINVPTNFNKVKNCLAV